MAHKVPTSRRYVWLIAALSLFLVFSECMAQGKEGANPPKTRFDRSACADYVLDEAHNITDFSKIPKVGSRGNYSPDGKLTLEEIVIIPPKPNVVDGSYRYAYYSETENIFWILDVHGLTVGSGWYGPYEGYPCSK